MNVSAPFLQARVFAPVSAVVPCYRCTDTVGDAVASIAAQTLPPAEILLVDDCSGDGTLEMLRSLADAYPAGWIKVVALPVNSGPSRARNAGWEQAGQEYIAFLDSDDTWAPRKLELQMQALTADPEIALISHRVQVRERGLESLPLRKPIRTRIVSRRRLLLNNPFPTPSVVLRRDLPFRFNEKFRYVEDYLLWAQIAHTGYRCAKVNQVLAYLHKPAFGAGGLSGDLDAMHRAGREVGNELQRMGLVSARERMFTRSLGKIRRARRHLVLWLRRFQSGGHPSP
ncbi:MULTISPECIES: glycosyltransferase family 2 protein [unclassified Pseudoxanthomonas]|uniref:glycosyltransferase family 2 protein n=1 Tax=unclassified Pseudoxanthomonas TaxID=2645906 RepID=UPI003077AA56